MLKLNKSMLDDTIKQWNEIQEIRKTLQLDCDRLSKQILERIQGMPPISGDITSMIENGVAMERALAIHDIEFWLRQYVRCFYALVEAMNHNYKAFAVSLPQTHYVFSDEEISKTREDNKIRLLDNLDIAVDFLIKAFDLSLILKKSDHRYGYFKQGVTIRDKLTHPKSITDIEINYSKMNEFGEGVGWYYEQIANIFEECLEQMNSLR